MRAPGFQEALLSEPVPGAPCVRRTVIVLPPRPGKWFVQEILENFT